MSSVIEIQGNLWELHAAGIRVCITTSGSIDYRGMAIMGRGCAFEAKCLWPRFPARLAKHLQEEGNVPYKYKIKGMKPVFTLPVKHTFRNKARIDLIQSGLITLVDWLDGRPLIIPRPGCGNGGLKWSYVKKEIKSIVPHTFMFIHQPKSKLKWGHTSSPSC